MKLAKVAASTDEENFNKMKTVYESCMNEDALLKVGAYPLVQLVNQVIDKFPAEGKSSEVPKDPLDTLSHAILFLEQYGVTTFEAMGTGADDKNPVSSPPVRP
jgi:endothelin-converting enzyme